MTITTIHPAPFLLLTAALLATACGGEPTPGGEEPGALPPDSSLRAPPPDARMPAVDTGPGAIPRAATSPASKEDWLTDMLAVDGATLAAFRTAFGAPQRVEREPQPNRHVPDQTDTILTLHYPDARFRLYQVTGGGTMLEQATVSANRYLRHGAPAIGTPADSLVAWWGKPDRRAEDALIYQGSGPVDEPVTFRIEDGAVAAIEKAYYVD